MKKHKKVRFNLFLKVIRSSLLLEKICLNKLNYTSDVCGNLIDHLLIQDEVQRHVTDFEAVKGTVSVVPKYEEIVKKNIFLTRSLFLGSCLHCSLVPGLMHMAASSSSSSPS